MNCPYSLPVLLATLIGTAGAMPADSPTPPLQRPNILFFLVDDMGVTDTSVGFLQDAESAFIQAPLNNRYRTPNMQRLAEQGMRFTNAYAYTVCTPTRASLISGLEASRLHITTWTHPQQSIDTGLVDEGGLHGPAWQVKGLDPQQFTLPKLLASGGYRTIHCGKAHFGPNDTLSGDPRNLGFQVSIAGHGGGGPGSYWGEKNFSAAWRNGGHMWDVPGLDKYHGKDVYLTQALTLEMKTAIQEAVHDRKPFFAYMAHYAVHAPFEVDQRFANNYPDLKGKPLAFATMVEGMDKSLGDLLDQLKTLGVAEETLVIFYSDNGSDGPPNLPLRGIKGSRFMGGNRVPMIAAWATPNSENPIQKACPILAGSIEDDLITPADFLPTLATVAGIPLPAEVTVDGHDLTPYFQGYAGTHRPQAFLVHFPHGRHRSHLFSTWTDGDWKLAYEYAHRRWHLTNLTYDIGEQQNLVQEKPQLALAMARRMIDHLDGQDAKYPIDNTTQQPVKPDLMTLQEAVKQKLATTRQLPFPEDDLDLASLIQPVTAENIYRDDGWYTWCNNIIKGDDGTYHLFYVRWPKEYGFYAWLTHSEIARATSTHPAGPYTFAGKVIGRGSEHDRNWINAHNVKVKKFGDKYYLYFISQTDGGRRLAEQELVDTARVGYRAKYWGTLRNNQRTRVAIAASLEGPWNVHAKTVVEPNGPISTVTVNPAIWQSPDGKFHIIVKGDYPQSRVAQAHAVGNTPTGPFHVQQAPAFTRYSEDVSVWTDSRRGLIYGVLHDSKGFGVIASKDGYDWREARSFRAIGKQILRTDGRHLNPSRLERPSVFFERGAPRVLSAAVQLDHGKDAHIVLIPLE